MDLFAAYRQQVLAALEQMVAAGQLPAGLNMAAVTAESPKDPAHGDMSTNAAMVLAKAAGTNPRALAEALVPYLQKIDGVVSAEIAGPGFINLRLKPEVWLGQVTAILKEGRAYGQGETGKGVRVNVEYVSANPTGPMHIGHARGAVVGDVLASLLAKAGYTVTREYYINDAGAQVDVLARSTHLRYREALGENIGEIPAGLYPGDYLVPLGQELAKEHGDKYVKAAEDEWLPIFRQAAITAMLVMIKSDLALMGVKHDVFSSEAAMIASGKVEEALAFLEGKGLMYVGVLEPPKGKTPDDWEPRPQTLFKSSQFGDDVDRALKKSDGSYTYFTPDIAYHYDKYKRGADVLIDVLGADHGGYVKRIKAAVTAMSDGKASCEVLLCQLVKLMKDGEPFKMSKRAGTFVTLRDMVELIGKDVLRFIMLTRKSDAALEFDVELVKSQTKDNPVFYVQYAHARCHSALRLMEEAIPGITAQTGDVGLLNHPEVLGLIRTLSHWPRTVEQAARSYEPHRIAFYLQELAAQFHALWNQGGQDERLRFVQAGNPALTASYAGLLKAVIATLASGLEVMGVEALESM
ncbi:arginine--tRNA ligase [bacterium]|nr:arginine--tRNA ligase [bacterium]